MKDIVNHTREVFLKNQTGEIKHKIQEIDN